MSVTGLLKPPRITALERVHAGDLEEDASDRIWSLCGQVIHGILERAASNAIAERRLSIDVEGWAISGGMDLYHANGLLQDYKFVTVWKFKDDRLPIEYVEQLNCYAEILRRNGETVSRLQIVGILRDWSKLEARRDPNYPQTQIVVRDVPMWSPEKAYAFLRDRVILHKQAEIMLPLCSDEDRWAKPTTYALMKVGGKRAVKVYDNEKQARDHASVDPKNLRVEVRPGEATRCTAYCAVAKFCTQYQQQKAASQPHAEQESEKVAV
jgi:hypothetical protein